MSGFCAICTSERGPFEQRPLGRGGALVNVCSECDTAPARERHGPERPYEVPERQQIGQIAIAFAAGANRVTGDTAASNKAKRAGQAIVRDAQPGFVLVRVPRLKPDGTTIDAREARATLRDESWFREMHHLGSTRRYHLFERPDVEAARAARLNPAEPADALADLAALAKR